MVVTRGKLLLAGVIIIVIGLIAAGAIYFNNTEGKIQAVENSSPSQSASASSDAVASASPSVSASASSTDSASGATDFIDVKNLSSPAEAAQGNPEENYENAKKARNDGDVAAAIGYFRSAENSQDVTTAVAATSSIAQLEYLIQNPDNRLPVYNADEYTDGETTFDKNGSFSQGSTSFDVAAGDKVIVKKESYQVTITYVKAADNSKSYYTVVTR